MATTAPTLPLLLLLVLLLPPTLILSSSGDIERCREECRSMPHYDTAMRRRCMQQCEKWRDDKEEEYYGEERGGGRSSSYPYVLGRDMYKQILGSEHGKVRILERFDKILRRSCNIGNYRMGLLDANPNTFILPHHLDFDCVYYVINGRGKVTLLRGENRESHELRRGDIFIIPAGNMAYLINTDSNEKLEVAKLLKTISTQGQFKGFVDVGGQDPQTYFNVFSNDLIEAAFNTSRETLQRAFKSHRKGAIIRVEEHQMRALSKLPSHGVFHGSEKNKPFNLLQKRPSHANERGKLYDADVNDYEPLGNLDVLVSYVNITRGAMMAPFYNSRSTKIAMVVKGKGHFEMASPLLERGGGEEEEEEVEEVEEYRGQPYYYKKIQSRLEIGDTFVVPRGHPSIIVASSDDEDLELLCFETNAENNERYFLAGKNNVYNEMEDVVKEISFAMSSKEIDQTLLRSQSASIFLDGPEMRQQGEQEEGGDELGGLLSSILDVDGI